MNKTVKELLEDGDPVIQEITTRFLDEELSWDEFFDLIKIQLHKTGKDKDITDNYNRAMRGV